jgi:cytosine deaminase
MQLIKVKTARFADVVKSAGAPEVLAVWTDPRKDNDFQRALRAHRIMTVHQTVVGAKKDFAEVGFIPGPNVSYLQFPRSLEEFAGRRIVGVNYGLLAEAKGRAPTRKRMDAPPGKPRSSRKPIPAAPPSSPPAHGEAREKRREEKKPKRPAPRPVRKSSPAPAPDPVDPFMRAAIDEAKKSLASGGIPIGAALVRGKKLIATGHNKRVQDNDPVTHAETDCLRNAGRLGSFRGCTLYSTLMPCFFCAGAAVQFGIRKVVVGESRNFAGAPDFMRAHGIEVIDCDLAECREMMAHFIRTHRKLWQEDIGAA